MTLSRGRFFLLLFLLLVAPFYLYKLWWLSGSEATRGIGWFMGHTLENNGAVSQHLVVLFRVGGDSVWFNTADNWGFGVGDSIPVRYRVGEPGDARVNTTVAIWGDSWVDSFLPIGILLILFLTPERFDPLIPWRSKVRIGRRPFIQIIRTGAGGSPADDGLSGGVVTHSAGTGRDWR
jgi:hypothetical protein